TTPSSTAPTANIWPWRRPESPAQRHKRRRLRSRALQTANSQELPDSPQPKPAAAPGARSRPNPNLSGMSSAWKARAWRSLHWPQFETWECLNVNRQMNNPQSVRRMILELVSDTFDDTPKSQRRV